MMHGDAGEGRIGLERRIHFIQLSFHIRAPFFTERDRFRIAAACDIQRFNADHDGIRLSDHIGVAQFALRLGDNADAPICHVAIIHD
ncbi:hypothetical protein D3C81_914150 [compost metagenome]